MDKLSLGVEWNPETGRTGKPVTFDLSSHATLLGPTRCGKGATLEIPNLLLGLRHTSVVSIDPTAQNACVTAEARRKAGSKVLVLNPMGLHVGLYPDLQSCGCNPLVAGVDPRSPRFYEEAAAIGEAMIAVEGDPQRHFPESARGLITGLIMWVRLRDGDQAHLGTVLQLLTEAEQTDANGRPVKGLRRTAAEMVASQHFQIASLAARFIKDGSREIDSIRSTAETATRWLLSDPMRKDLARNGIDWGQLTRMPTTVFVILPAEDLEFHAVWLKLIVSCALNGIYRQAGKGSVLTLFMLAEFFALGHLKPVLAAMGQGAKYGVRLWPVLQDAGQLATLYGPHGASTFIGNSGCLFAFAPGEYDTAEFLSKHSGEQYGLNVSASDDAQGGVRRSYSPQRERAWPPDKISRVPAFHGLVWKYGNPQPQPVYCQPYFENPACLRLARADPYHRSKPAAPLVAGAAGLAARFRRWLWREFRLAVRDLRLVVIVGGAFFLVTVALGFLWVRFPETGNRSAGALGVDQIPIASHVGAATHTGKARQASRDATHSKTAGFMETLQKIGPFLSAIALFCGAAAGWVTYALYHRRVMYVTWIDGYRTLYAEFWKDEKIAKVRHWITSDIEYENIQKILIERMQSENNTLDNEQNIILDYIDQFCATLVRIEFFDRTLMSKRQRDLWNKTYGDFWITKIKQRDALRRYMEKYWPGLELRNFLRDNRSK